MEIRNRIDKHVGVAQKKAATKATVANVILPSIQTLGLLTGPRARRPRA